MNFLEFAEEILNVSMSATVETQLAKDHLRIETCSSQRQYHSNCNPSRCNLLHFKQRKCRLPPLKRTGLLSRPPRGSNIGRGHCRVCPRPGNLLFSVAAVTCRFFPRGGLQPSGNFRSKNAMKFDCSLNKAMIACLFWNETILILRIESIWR